MSYRDYCWFSELSLNQTLNLLLGHYVDVCCCFVEDNDLILSENSTADADKLAFSCAQVRTTLWDLHVDTTSWLSLLAFSSRRKHLTCYLCVDLLSLFVTFAFSLTIWLAFALIHWFRLTRDQILKTSLDEKFLDGSRRILVERIQIEPKRTSK